MPNIFSSLLPGGDALSKAIGTKTTPQTSLPFAGLQNIQMQANKAPANIPKPVNNPTNAQISQPKPINTQQNVQVSPQNYPSQPVTTMPNGTPLVDYTNKNSPVQQQTYQPQPVQPTTYSQAQQGLQQSGQATPMEQEYIQRIQNAQGQQNIGKLAPYAESGMWTGTPEPSTELLTRPDLAGRTAANQGIYNNLADIYGSQATAGLQAANTIAQRGQTAAQGLLTSTMPINVSPGNALISPTGQNVYPTGTQGQPDLNTLAQSIVSGKLSPSQAEAQVSYNPLLANQLYQTVQKLSPGFSYPTAEQNITAQGAGLTQNVQTGRAIQLASTSANQALDSLQTAYNGLGSSSQGSFLGILPNIPLVAQASQVSGMVTGYGREAISKYIGALAEARSQVRTVLGQAGVNPVDAGQISDSLLPDSMTPSEIPQKIEAAKAYIQNRVSGFTQTGNVPQNPQTGQTNTNAFSQSAIWGS